jgi:hypothetical protein
VWNNPLAKQCESLKAFPLFDLAVFQNSYDYCLLFQYEAKRGKMKSFFAKCLYAAVTP